MPFLQFYLLSIWGNQRQVVEECLGILLMPSPLDPANEELKETGIWVMKRLEPIRARARWGQLKQDLPDLFMEVRFVTIEGIYDGDGARSAPLRSTRPSTPETSRAMAAYSSSVRSHGRRTHTAGSPLATSSRRGLSRHRTRSRSRTMSPSRSRPE